MVVRPRVHLQGHGTHVRCESTRGQQRARPRRLVRHDDPRPSVKQVGVGRTSTGALAASHRVGSHVPARRVLQAAFLKRREHVGDDGVLHRGDVRDDRSWETQERIHDDTISDVRRRSHHNDARSLVTGRIRSRIRVGHPGLVDSVTEGDSRAHVGCKAQRSRRRVLEVDAHSPGSQRQAEGCTQEARTDDKNRTDRGDDARGCAHRPTAPYSAVKALPLTRRVVPCLR